MDFWALLWNTWNDRGASVMVPSGYTLTLWQHDKSGLDEKFNGVDTCQKMSGNLVRQMSHIETTPMLEDGWEWIMLQRVAVQSQMAQASGPHPPQEVG